MNNRTGGLNEETTTSRQFDPAALSDRQRSGHACVICHAEPDVMTPLGSTVHGQVFACASHTELVTCPSCSALNDARDTCRGCGTPFGEDRAGAETVQAEQPEAGDTVSPGCQPWCVRHDDGDICTGADLDAGDVYGGVVGLTYTPDEGHRVYLDRCDGMEPEQARQFAQAILAQVGTAEARQEEIPPISEAWEESARKAGERAAFEVRAEYRATMRAQANDDGPAFWLSTYPCPDWCEFTEMHQSSDHPDDRSHTGTTHMVDLVSMPPVPMVYADGTRFAAPALHLSLIQEVREVEPRITLSDSGDQLEMHLTLDEAEQAIAILQNLVASARGRGWGPVVTPFDPQGRCSEPSCTVCKATNAATASS
ncbi:DUF6907 domain-containing protein [Nonomuraea sediminis]|uniref:DUF6907 domain-containing protein n=1 Tax=Nonomuraea sediminis TaxID=2835864 RepID=UPI001BDD2F22|nr:hypothetical protein [Nonomuraea sediminis]